MKIAALTALGLVFVLSGQYMACVLNGRVRMLEKIQLMLTAAENSISFLQSPSDGIIKSLSENAELKELKFLAECRAEMCGGTDFPEAWKSSVSKKDNTRYLKDGDRAVLVSFGELFGTTDAAGQISNCRIHSELVRDRLSAARAERGKYAPLVCGMGAVFGIGVIIMLI